MSVWRSPIASAAACGVILGCLAAASVAAAAEPFEAFLEALQERGHFDLALRYLDHMADSDLAPSGVRETVDFRRAMVQVQAARVQRNPTLRQQQLDQAQRWFDQFLRDHAQHSSAATARGQLGNVLVERARWLMQQSQAATANDQQLEQVRRLFARAHELILAGQENIAEQLKAMRGIRDRESLDARDELRTEYVQLKLMAARVLLEQADAWKDDTDRYEAKLRAAAGAFEEVAQKYRKWTAGLYAVLYEGECYQRLGEHQRALSYFAELIQEKSNAPAIRRVKTRALTLAIDSWLRGQGLGGEAGDGGGYERAIALATKWLTTTRANEERDPAWIALRLRLARAYQRKAIAAGDTKEASRAASEARKIAEEIAKRRSPSQEAAQTLLVSLGRSGQQEETPVSADQAANFAEAREAARKALDDMKVADATVRILQSQVDKVSDPERLAEIKQRLSDSRQKVQELASRAQQLLVRALELGGTDDIEELNGVRYYLAYLYYTRQDYRRAAVLASFVATRYPDGAAARECANVALAAHQQLYQRLTPEHRAAQARRIARIAELMVQKWPGQSQAGAALITLLDVSLQQGELEKAEEFLARIPTDAPRRADAELRMGQSLWRAYLRELANQDGEQAANDASLSELKTRAGEILAQGLARVARSQPTETIVRSALSLAQIHADSGQPTQALDVLTHPGHGPLTIVRAGGPLVAEIPGLEVEAYKTAIRAQVAAAALSDDVDASIQAARRMLEQLSSSLEGQPDGREKIISIYVGLARDLQRQLTLAAPENKRELSAGFETFLRSAGQAGEDPTVLNWVAETFYDLGASLRKTEGLAAARRYFQEAADTYARVVDLHRQQPDKLDQNTLLQVQYRQALAWRALGEYEWAVAAFGKLLRQHNKVLTFQTEAARTFQRWGEAGNPAALLKAVQGDRPGKDGRNVIWGWGRLASIIGRPELFQQDSKYRQQFHEARYNIALCHFTYAMAKPDQRRQLLFRAKSDITMTRRLYPRLGGDRQRETYEALLRKIQQELGEQPVGFSAEG